MVFSQNLSNFVSIPWKLHNWYCHSGQLPNQFLAIKKYCKSHGCHFKISYFLFAHPNSKCFLMPLFIINYFDLSSTCQRNQNILFTFNIKLWSLYWLLKDSPSKDPTHLCTEKDPMTGQPNFFQKHCMVKVSMEIKNRVISGPSCCTFLP